MTLVAVLVLAQTGCDPNPGEGGSQRAFVTIGTAPAGGAFAPVGNAITNVVSENQGDQDWVVTAMETRGTQENIRNLESGKVEFGMANAAISYFANRGEGQWATPHAVRTVATIAPNVGVFVTLEGSGIDSMADLKGKRVVLGPAGAGFKYFLEPLLKAHGLTYDDITEVNGTYLEASELLSDGKADAAFMGGAIPIGAVSQLCRSQDVKFIPFDADAPEKLKEYPFYFTVPVPADTYPDLNEDLVGINVGNMHFITHEKVDEDLVYNVTKRIYENREEVAKQHPAGKALNPKNIIRDTGTPFHPGAIRYYKEAGIWPGSETEADSGD